MPSNERREWFTPAEIVAAKSPELPGTVRNINLLADARGWRADPAKARRVNKQGGGWEYHVTLLPPGAQARLALLFNATGEPEARSADDASKTLWARFESLSKKQKLECERRLAALTAAERMEASGLTATAATSIAAREAHVSPATLWNWRKLVTGVARADWLAGLAASYRPTAAFSDCHPNAFEAFTSDWLRPEKPTFSACFRRMRKLASANGWLPIPSERALRRRVDAEIASGVKTLARDGRDKAKTLYPAQRRIRTHFHAMQAVNMDGHKIDVFVLLKDGRVVRMQLIALQDLFSGMIVAWRLSESENKETVRLVIGDMVERYGIPDKIYLDNGRAFASKWITGGTKNRFRFTIRDEDPRGLLTTLGVEVNFTQPYSGQSKPIERAFRDLADAIAKHPFCAGAYTGNRPDAKPENYGSEAIPLAAFRDHVAVQIEEHNAMPGRRSDACGGRSFVETFNASMAEDSTIVRWPSEAQKSLWLLAADRVRAKRGSGEIELFENRYWAAPLNAVAGQHVTVRFDPDRLQDELRVYDASDRLICVAPCIAATGFDDAEAARTHARDRGSYLKLQREQQRLHQKLTADELARLYGGTAPAAAPAPTPPKVKRLATGGAPIAMPVTDFETDFSRGLRLIDGDADVIPFTPRLQGRE